MPYTLHRKVTLKGFSNKTVIPLRRTPDLKADSWRRDTFETEVAEFSDGSTGTLYGIEGWMNKNDVVSVAINESKQVIALVNHTTGKQTTFTAATKTRIGDWVSALIYLVPIAAFGIWLIITSLPDSKNNLPASPIPLAIGVAAVGFAGFIFYMVGRMNTEAQQALKELSAS